MANGTTDVLILGAGVAGLAAARDLSQAGVHVTVIEARGRIGGRVHTEHLHGYPLPIELGAEFIHGRPAESFALVEQSGLLVYEINGEGWQAKNGRLTPSDELWEQTDKLFAQMARVSSPDISLDTFLARFRDKPGWQDAIAMAASYAEGFDAADTHAVSVQSLIREQQAAHEIDGDSAFRIANGYDTFVAALARECVASHTELHLNTLARSITWRRGHVEIETESSQGGNAVHFAAPRALVTLPLGVLQAPAGAHGAVEFRPGLGEHATALRQLAMGQVVKITLRFRERFWEHESLPLASEEMDPRRVSFFYSRGTAIPTWWTAYPAVAAQLTAWAGGPAAERLLALGQDALVEQALGALAQVLGMPHSRVEAQLIEAHYYNWHADPFARGAYSYVTVGGMDAVRTLAAPLEGTLFFAGEATNGEGATGTVHGAIATGRRAAREMLLQLK